MKALMAALIGFLLAGSAVAGEECPALLDQRFESLQDGQPKDLCQYRGNVVLVVNTASYCGFTHQYEGLEELQRRYREDGLVVLGFPSNDFGGQEPGDNQQIAEFCRTTYGIKFPMFAKSNVRGASANPLYVELARRSGAKPGWNFHKYLIGRNGSDVQSFASSVEPLDGVLVEAIEASLRERASEMGRDS